ncbi:peptidyl-prolyl cis-trans isomerase CYP18-2 [Tanacetum coccineum]
MSGGPPEVTLETSMGSFTVEMYDKHAPRTCKNFFELSRRGYYNNVKFHRIIKDFIIQGGDPTGTGRGGESIYGSKFEDEITPKLKHTGAGILSMANAGPNTNGSQFFITLAPTPSLDGKHTIFGRVCRGMEIVKRLGSVQTDNTDRFKASDAGRGYIFLSKLPSMVLQMKKSPTQRSGEGKNLKREQVGGAAAAVRICLILLSSFSALIVRLKEGDNTMNIKSLCDSLELPSSLDN